ncbi:MAG: hypothetical protein KJZ78_14125 [Bryobacteraceae bacterium]|nr:hypothetical protein [Bryobacteraceae bacterium]
METHVRILGYLYLVFGCLGVLGGLVALVFFGGIAGLAGIAGSDPDAWVAVPILGGIGGILFVIVLLFSLPAVIAGAGLLQFKNWARILAIILSAINLLNMPFGTALGVYGLWALLSNDTVRLFLPRPLPPSRL